MAIDRTPVLKRCRSLDMDPVYLGVNKKIQQKVSSFQQKDQRVWSSASRKTESKIHLRRIRKTFQKLLC